MDVAAIPLALNAGIKRVNETMVSPEMKAEFEFHAGHYRGGARLCPRQ